MNFVADPAQQRFVQHRLRRQIGGKHQGDVERYRFRVPAAQSQYIDAVVERTGQAVQQLGCRHALAPQVVDHEQATAGLELRRRMVDADCRIETQIEHLARQFGPHLDHRPLAHHPAHVAAALIELALVQLWRRPVQQRVVELHDLVTKKERVRHSDDPLQQTPQLARQRGLAAA